MRISRTVAQLPPSGIRAFFDLVAASDDIVSLGVGEPDFVTPWNVCESGIFALERGYTSYTSNKGTPEFRQSVARYQKGLIGQDFDPESEILATVGVSQGMDIAMRAILNPGDEVILFQPCFVSYAPMISLAGGTPVPVQLKGDAFEPDVDGVKKAITGKTRAILICSPNNPTGTVASGETLSQLAALCREHDLIAISDEIYAELVYEGGHKSIIQQPDMRERTLVLNGLSKSQAMTGWRIGYACGPEDIISAMLKIHQYSMMCASITAQMAGQEALDHGAEIQKKTRREYNRRRQFIISSLNEMGLKCHMPGGAFYAFPSIKSKGLDSEEFCRRLLEEEKVAVVPGSAFGLGGEGHIRCAYAASMDDIRTAMGRMAGFVQRM